jgi:hypothetical protein
VRERWSSNRDFVFALSWKRDFPAQSRTSQYTGGDCWDCQSHDRPLDLEAIRIGFGVLEVEQWVIRTFDTTGDAAQRGEQPCAGEACGGVLIERG